MQDHRPAARDFLKMAKYKAIVTNITKTYAYTVRQELLHTVRFVIFSFFQPKSFWWSTEIFRHSISSELTYLYENRVN